MPLALQALLPFMALLIAAGVVAFRPRRPENGWIAVGATAISAAIIVVELVRLAPGERVDVPYLTTFPYADLGVRLDALSLSFSAVTLFVAALLMLARLRAPGDRRDPWRSWLLTSAAVLAVMMAPNLLLVYILLQVLTLAWNGTVDEAAPRHRTMRMVIGVADIGLLLAAASAIQSVGTSAFSGVPSDTFGPAAFLLALLPVVVRIAALAWGRVGPMPPVAFEPAVAFVAPAAYVLLRMIALSGGHLPGRPLQILVFSTSLLVALAAAGWALAWAPTETSPTALLVAQAALGLAFLASSIPLLGAASLWIFLQLIPLTGLCSVPLEGRRPAAALAVLALSMLPGSAAFIGLWIAGNGLRASGQPGPLLGVMLVAVVVAAAALSSLRPVDRRPVDVAAGWGIGMFVVAAAPGLFLAGLILPSAQSVRPLAAGSITLGPVGFSLAGVLWPAPIATVLLLGAAWLVLLRNRISIPGVHPRALPVLPRLPDAPRIAIPGRWLRRIIWTGFIAVVALAVLRP